jgi:arylsulfatase A-like enzyme
MKLFLPIIALSLALAAAHAAEPQSPRRPNIVFLLSDDQRWDAMGCAGNAIIRTPQMDALAREGVRFRNMFVTTPICAASRASIFTGLYERTHRFTFGTAPIADKHTDISYPVLLRRAGYRTGFVGKFGVGVESGGTQRMFDYFVPLDRNPYFKKQPDGSERHLTDIETDKAIAFLDTVKPGEPFCLSVSFNAPHAEDNDPRQYFWPHACDELYEDAIIPVPTTMTDEFFNAQPEFLRNSESRVRFNWRFDEPRKYQEMVKGYFRMIAGVDMAIGRIRGELEKRGLAANTVIVFASDNGYFLGERGFADKWYIYEPSIRVPLIVFDPRAEKSLRGRVAGATVLNVDIAPTVLDVAGVEIPKLAQGRSVAPLLAGSTPADWRTDFFFEHLFERKNIPKSEGVRTERWSYVRWFEQKPLVEELYDHEADFDEAHNLAGDPKFADVLEQLRKRTDELRDRYGGPYVPNPAKPAKQKSKASAGAGGS